MIPLPWGLSLSTIVAGSAAVLLGVQTLRIADLKTELAEATAAVQVASSQQTTAEQGRESCEFALERAGISVGDLRAAISVNAGLSQEKAEELRRSQKKINDIALEARERHRTDSAYIASLKDNTPPVSVIVRTATVYIASSPVVKTVAVTVALQGDDLRRWQCDRAENILNSLVERQ